MQEYPVFTLWQPWAVFLVLGIKGWETRSWPLPPSKKDKPVLIHAAKVERYAKEAFNDPIMGPLLREAGFNNYKDLEYGHIIGAVTFTECHEILNRPELKPYNEAELYHPYQSIPTIIHEPEIHLGDYRPGRYAWRSDSQGVLRTPIEHKGQQGWGKYTPEKPLEFIENQKQLL